MNKSELLEKLCKCQIIDIHNELYQILNDIDEEDMIDLKESLDGGGYNLTYNNLDDCFVIS